MNAPAAVAGGSFVKTPSYRYKGDEENLCGRQVFDVAVLSGIVLSLMRELLLTGESSRPEQSQLLYIVTTLAIGLGSS